MCSWSTRAVIFSPSGTRNELATAAEGDLEKRLLSTGTGLCNPPLGCRPALLIDSRNSGYRSRFWVCPEGVPVCSAALLVRRGLLCVGSLARVPCSAACCRKAGSMFCSDDGRIRRLPELCVLSRLFHVKLRLGMRTLSPTDDSVAVPNRVRGMKTGAVESSV